MSQQFDVIICGAGPAGATCALALGESNLKVLLIDKSSFPRDKICGDAIAPYVPKVLNTINPKYKEQFLAFSEKAFADGCRIVAPNGKMVDLTIPEDGFLMTRMVFDNFLMDLVKKLPNIHLLENTKAIDAGIEADKAWIKNQDNTIFEAQLIIGCDGAQGIVSKKLTDNKVDLEHYCGAVRAYYKNVSDIPFKKLEFHFRKELLPGYFWIFPMKDNLVNVGLGMHSHAIADGKVNLRNTMQQIIETDPILKERFKNAEQLTEIKGFGLPLFSRKITISGHRFMLCGDAASLIDPSSGEGIGQATVSGRYAGWQAIKCFKNNNFSAQFMDSYNQDIYKKLWRRSYTSNLFRKYVCANETLFNLFVRLSGYRFFYNLLMRISHGL